LGGIVIRIHRELWYFINESNILPSIDYKNIQNLRCSNCGDSLEGWYDVLVYKLKEFIPENHQHLCCRCNLIEALCWRDPLVFNCCEDPLLKILTKLEDYKITIECINCYKKYLDTDFRKAHNLLKNYLKSKFND